MNLSLRRTFRIVLGVTAWVLLYASSFLHAQQNETRLPGLDQFLNPDGTFNDTENYTGSIDARGWRIETGTDGAPRFVPEGESGIPAFAVPDDDNWDNGFGNGPGSNGIDDEVFALASDGIRLYVGGAFTKAGDVLANNIVSWDGERWQILGTGPGILNGVNGIVNAIVVDGDIIYVGGQFTNAGGTPVRNIARYSISSRTWANMTGGITGPNAFVSSIVIDGDNVYVGGIFAQAGSVTADNIGVWNKTTQVWTALGGEAQGVEGNVNAIAKGPDGIYVGGSFSSAGGVATSSIARWDGTTWHSLAGGVNGAVNAIAVLQNRVFVGGDFDRAGDTAVNNIARWYVDSSLWSRLTGIYELVGEYTRVEDNGVHDVVRTIVVDGNNVYVGGTYRSAFPGDLTLDPVNTNYIARWFEPTDREWWQTNTWWAPLGRGAQNGTNGFVNAIAMFEGELYAAGTFSRAGGQNADRIARWDGLRWLSLTTGVNNFIFNLTLTDDGEVYVGGEFNQTGSSSEMGIAKLDGSRWDLVDGSIRGSIYALAASGDWIYVGGQFRQAGEAVARNVARWNRVAEEWSTLGAAQGPGSDSTLSYVATIAIQGDDVYLGGLFSSAGGISANGIVRWNSATDTWSNLGSGINGSVFAIEFDDEDIYVAGRFLGAGSQSHAKNIALWNGDWQALDTGVSKAIWSMGLRGSELFVGGEFTRAGSIDVNHLAAWNTDAKSWSNPGGGVNDDFLPVINSIVLTDRRLYVGGIFSVAGEQPVSNVASWDGGSWNGMGSGVDNYVYQMAVSGNKVYVAGAFTEAGAKPSYYFGIYTDPTLSADRESATALSPTFDRSSPNPFAGSTTLSFSTTTWGRVTLTVHDLNGKSIARIVDNTLPPGEHRVTWNPEGISAGVYIGRLETDGNVLTRKMVIVE